MYNESSSGRVASSEEEIDNPDGKDVFEEPFQKLIRTKTDYFFVYFQHTFSFLNLLLHFDPHNFTFRPQLFNIDIFYVFLFIPMLTCLSIIHTFSS